VNAAATVFTSYFSDTAPRRLQSIVALVPSAVPWRAGLGSSSEPALVSDRVQKSSGIGTLTFDCVRALYFTHDPDGGQDSRRLAPGHGCCTLRPAPERIWLAFGSWHLDEITPRRAHRL
jgi:hypothetical protein